MPGRSNLMTQGYLIEAEELHELVKQNQVFVIDTRDPLLYQKAHIPGSVNIDEIFSYLCTGENGGYPALAKFFAGLFGDAGLKPSDHVVVYEDALDNGYGQSCRGWLILSYLKQSQVSVLHGGMRAWSAKNLPLTAETPRYESTEYPLVVDPSYVATTEEMLKAIDDPNTIIVDVRDYAEWIGANSSPYGYSYCPRKGRIPTARWLEWYRLMRHKSGIPWFKSSDEILEICEPLEITPQSKVILYCFKGARTSNTMLALRNAGIKNVRNYFLSWNEWSRNLDLPIEEGYPQ